jgi:hypothetical protein
MFVENMYATLKRILVSAVPIFDDVIRSFFYSFNILYYGRIQFVTPVTGLNRPNTGKGDDGD